MSPLAETRAWLRDVVIGLDLCPFARDPVERGELRMVRSEATELRAALEDLMREAARLEAPRSERSPTTLLLLPHGLERWDDFLDATALAEDLLDQHACSLQLVPFHPDFCFEGASPEDPANAVNRSPTPMWHLLRRADVAAAIASHPDPEGIAERNMELLRRLATGA